MSTSLFRSFLVLGLMVLFITPQLVFATIAADQAKNNQVASQVLAAFGGVPEITVTAIDASKAGAPAPGTSVDVNGFVLQKEGALAAAAAMKSGMAMGLKPNAKDEPGFHINATLEEHFNGRWGVLVGSMTEIIAGPADVAKAEQARKRAQDAALSIEPEVPKETEGQPDPSEPPKQMGTVGIPEMPTLPGTLNDALEAAGLKEEAIAQVAKAIELSPRKQVLHVSYGYKLIELGRIEEGREALMTAYRLDPSFEDVAISAAAGIILTGDVAGGKALLVEAVGTTTPHSPALFYAYYQTKQWNDLVAVGRAAVTASSGSAEARYRFAQALAAAGRFNESRVEIEQTMEAFPETQQIGERLLREIFGPAR